MKRLIAMVVVAGVGLCATAAVQGNEVTPPAAGTAVVRTDGQNAGDSGKSVKRHVCHCRRWHPKRGWR